MPELTCLGPVLHFVCCLFASCGRIDKPCRRPFTATSTDDSATFLSIRICACELRLAQDIGRRHWQLFFRHTAYYYVVLQPYSIQPPVRSRWGSLGRPLDSLRGRQARLKNKTSFMMRETVVSSSTLLTLSTRVLWLQNNSHQIRTVKCHVRKISWLECPTRRLSRGRACQAIAPPSPDKGAS